jgi:hypothetical protein
MQTEKGGSTEWYSPFLDSQELGARSSLAFHPAFAAFENAGSVTSTTGHTLPRGGRLISRFQGDSDADKPDYYYDQHRQRERSHSQSLLIDKHFKRCKRFAEWSLRPCARICQIARKVSMAAAKQVAHPIYRIDESTHQPTPDECKKREGIPDGCLPFLYS